MQETVSVRKRVTAVLFGGVALGSTAYVAAVTIATLAVDEITGSAALAGVPWATATLGTAVGTSLLTRNATRRGRRPGLAAGYAAAVVGSALSILGLTGDSLPLLFTGMALLGLGNASGHLARYAPAHTLGMFALSPVTGRLTDRWGGYRVIMALLGLSALGAAYGPNDSTSLLVVVLFALGYGWNLAFVAGSSLLTIGVGSEIRSRLQGRVDSLTWTASALASVSSGVIFQASDYRAISLIGLFLLVVPVVVMLRDRGAPLAVRT